jgi:hypothetical protein
MIIPIPEQRVMLPTYTVYLSMVATLKGSRDIIRTAIA